MRNKAVFVTGLIWAPSLFTAQNSHLPGPTPGKKGLLPASHFTFGVSEGHLVLFLGALSSDAEWKMLTLGPGLLVLY